MSRDCGHFHSYAWPSPFISNTILAFKATPQSCSAVATVTLLQPLRWCCISDCRWCVRMCNTRLSRDNFVFDVGASQLVGWLISCFWNWDEWLSGILTPQPTGRWCCVHTNRHRHTSRNWWTYKHTYKCKSTHRYTSTHSHTQIHRHSISQEAVHPVWLIKHTHTNTRPS